MSSQHLPTVAVLMGGPSRERPISIKSGTAVAEALRSAGCRVHDIVFDAAELPPIPADAEVVFPVLHGAFGEDGQIQRLLEEAGHAYVGCDATASGVIIDKAAFKEAVRAAGASCPEGLAITCPDTPFPEALGLPLIVKPNREGSTIGLTLVETAAQWPQALADALACDTVILAESFVRGIECTVAVLNGQALPMVEIIPPGGLFDHDAKYAQTRGATVYNCPPKKITSDKQALAAAVAERIYDAVGARDMLRVDMILNEQTGDFVVLEGNSLPGFTATSLMPKAAAAAGIPFRELCLTLVRQAAARGAAK